MYSDEDLHTVESTELEALFVWLSEKPHMTSSGNPGGRTQLLQICLGIGLLLKDANLIQYTEDGDHAEETPKYITESNWGITELDAFGKYIKKVQGNISKSPTAAR